MPHPQRQIATAICRLALALAATLGLSFWLTASADALSLVSQPSASTRPGTGVEEIVARGSDNHVYYTSFNGSQWTGWTDLGGIATGRPAVFSWAANHVDIYSRDGDNRLMHKYWTGTAWTGWQPICGAAQLASDPTIVSWGPGRVDAFAKGTGGELIHCYYNGSSWSNWASKGGSLISKPVVTSLMPGRLSVYALGTGGIMSHIYWDNANGAWSGWDRIGNLTYTDAPAVSKWYDGSAQQINIYARRSNSDPALYENWWSNANSWTFDTSMGGNVAGTPTTASMNYGHLDLFARSGVDNTLYNRSCCYPGWTGWVRRGPSVIALGSDPSAVGYPGHMSVYALDTGGSLLHTAWYDGGWHDWNYLGQPGGANQYPTSMEYGGYDRSVNNQTEFVNLYQALTVASDSVADQILAGLSPTDRQALFTWAGNMSPPAGTTVDDDGSGGAAGASWHWRWDHSKLRNAAESQATIAGLHDQARGAQAVAFLLGFVPTSWPAAIGLGLGGFNTDWLAAQMQTALDNSNGRGTKTTIGAWCKSTSWWFDLVCKPKIAFYPR